MNGQRFQVLRHPGRVDTSSGRQKKNLYPFERPRSCCTFPDGVANLLKHNGHAIH
jgi:hypothetical protein